MRTRAFIKEHLWVLVMLVLFTLSLYVVATGTNDRVDKSNQQVLLLYQAQISACEQNNQLRVEANRRIRSQGALATGLLDFLDAGRVARLQDNDPLIAAQFARIERRVRASAPVYTIEQVDCKKLIPEPIFE
jgi:hypothetical protein